MLLPSMLCALLVAVTCHQHGGSLPCGKQPAPLGILLAELETGDVSPKSVPAAVPHVQVFNPCHLANNYVGGLPSRIRDLLIVSALNYLLAATGLSLDAAIQPWVHRHPT